MSVDLLKWFVWSTEVISEFDWLLVGVWECGSGSGNQEDKNKKEIFQATVSHSHPIIQFFTFRKCEDML